MGTTHSSPIGSRHRRYNHQSHREPIAYSANFGSVRFRPNCQRTIGRSYSKTNRTSVENNNIIKCTDPARPLSYGPSTTNNSTMDGSVKKSRSILISSWNFAKKTASAVVPSLLVNSSRSSVSLSSKESLSPSKRRSTTSSQRDKHILTSRQISASSSRDSNISCIQQHYHHQSSKERDGHRRLDELNCNSIINGWESAQNHNKPIAYTRNKSSQDSLNLFSCQKYYDEQAYF